MQKKYVIPNERSQMSSSKRAADNMRVLALSMVEKAVSGHPGGSMGGCDFVHVLYSEFLRFDPDNRSWHFRDRFFLDPGHLSPMLYAQLAMIGAFSADDLKLFRQWDSITPGHPEADDVHGIENSSGPLGMGHAMALGSAIAERFYAKRFGEWMSHRTYAYISDGGIQEEISQGVGRIAGHLGLSNFVMFFDSNDIQLSHKTDACTSEDTAAKYESWGWRVETIDGNDHDAIRSALKNAIAETKKPTLIIGKTVMGKGAKGPAGESFEHLVSTHGQPLSKAGASIENTIKNLGGDVADPFAIWTDVAKLYADSLDKKRSDAAAFRKLQAEWEKSNAELSVKLTNMLDCKVPDIDWSAIKRGTNGATRVYSGDILSVFADRLENMVVSSADLCNSDNTQRFLDKRGQINRGDFSGSFIQPGVAELTMAAIANGLSLHGGIFPVCATFFVFSDYMKPAMRMAALMGLPVKYVFTHDSFRVGEDGPTHQPIEHETQIRLLEKMTNLEGHASMLVLRPADAAETVQAWRMAIENTESPTALILSRQNIAELPVAPELRFAQSEGIKCGGYIVTDSEKRPDIILVANGSELSISAKAATILSQKGLAVRTVSLPSSGLFLRQSASHRESVLPFGVPVFAVTAGLPIVFADVVGPFGKAYGLERFGASAPANVLDEKFGYTPEAVATAAEKFLGEFKVLIDRIKSL